MPFSPQNKTQLPMFFGISMSLLLHFAALAFFTFQMRHDMELKEPHVMRVQIVSAPKAAKKPEVVKEASAPKQPPVKTQHSAAPPKPVEKQIVQKPSKAPTKLVQNEKTEPKPIPKKIEKPQERPPVLDRTPEKKKVIKSEAPEAKTIKPPEDFLAALDFVDDLKVEAEKAEQNQLLEEETADENVELSYADQSIIGEIKKHIERFWIRPPGLRVEELGAILEIRTTPDGMVESMKLVQSSGQTFYDNSIKRAIRKAQPLPIPVAKYAIFKVLELHFKG